MKLCVRCGTEKSLDDFYLKRGKPNSWCKRCTNEYSADRVKAWRHRTKQKLIEHFGGICVDCKRSYPPFVMDFDHREPNEKEFRIGGSYRAKWDDLLAEAEKCDLVCSNCHRMRTHIQRCSGCEHCIPV